MSIWQEMTTVQRGDLLRKGTDELLKSLTTQERDCMFTVHMQEACGEPIDARAKRVIEDAVNRFNVAWKQTIERDWNERKTRENPSGQNCTDC